MDCKLKYSIYGEVEALSLNENQSTIKLRIDVDYPYPSSRKKSFLYVALGIKTRKTKDFLKNARIIAEIINASPKKIMAYWFFTPYTIPDKKLLEILNSERHEVGLHIATNPFKEWKILERETGRPIHFYTFHGTSNLLAQLLWKRKPGQKQVVVPSDFPLKSFHDFRSTGLDRRIYEIGLKSVKRESENWIKEGTVISIHPEWLFKRAEKNRRGPFYEALKIILGVQ
jgi:hypothetical protein